MGQGLWNATVLLGLGALASGTLPPSLPKQLFSLSAAPVLLGQAPAIDNAAILAEINRLRQDPAAYADWLETIRPYYRERVLSWPGETRIQTEEGTQALDEAIAALRQTSPLPPLTLADGLTQAAQDHVQDLLQTRRFSAEGSDGSTPEERIRRYGLPEGLVRELMIQGLRDPRAIAASLVIDDGNPSRSYRQVLLSNTFYYAGLECLPNGQLSLCVMNFAALYTDADAVIDSPFEATAEIEDLTAGVDLTPPEAAAIAATSPDAPEPESPLTEDNPFTEALTPESLAELATAIVVETNLLRADPTRYAEKLAVLRPYYSGNLIKIPGQPAVETVEGVAALDEAIVALQSASPVPTLTATRGMSQGAADHANDIGPQGGGGHYGTDGSDPLERIQRYGTVPPGNRWGENITYGPPTLAEWHVIQLVVDDNVPNRGHRQALLRPEYRFTGVACAPHAVFRIVCVATYASDYEE